MSKEQSDFDPVQLLKSHDKSLYVHCGDYIESLGFTQQEQIVAYKFLEELEPTGWVDVTAKNVAIQTLVDLNVVEECARTPYR